MRLIERIVELSDKYEDQLINLRRRIHENPELAHQEYETSKLVEDYLSELGIESRRIGETGILGILKGSGDGKTLLIRADMDALPIDEDLDLDFKSKKKGIMHACGHDVHTANLLLVARILQELRDQWKGTIKFIFQPAEERGGGAKDMIEEGVLENPKVDLGLALHVMSIEEGKILVNDGNILASSDGFLLKVSGKKAHTRRPQDGIDAINIASHIVVALNSVLSKYVGPQEIGTFSIGTIQGGSASNIVADEVELKGMIRTLDPSAREAIRDNIKKISQGIAQSFGGKCEFRFRQGYPAVKNHKETTKLLAHAFRENQEELYKGYGIHDPGKLILSDSKPLMAADDFGFFSEKIPSVYYMVGTGDSAPNHSSKFFVNENYMKLCTRTMVLAAISLLK